MIKVGSIYVLLNLVTNAIVRIPTPLSYLKVDINKLLSFYDGDMIKVGSILC